MAKPKVECLGELVIDNIGDEINNSATHFQPHAAGTPANVAVALARQGISSGIIGRLGDAHSQWFLEQLAGEGLDTRHIVVDRQSITRSIDIVRSPNGLRKVVGCLSGNCADRNLCPEDVASVEFDKSDALFFSSTVLSTPQLRATTRFAIERAAAAGLLVACDLNIWPQLWSNKREYQQRITDHLRFFDVLKLNRDELELLTSHRDSAFASTFRAMHNIPLLLLTADKDGAYAFTEKETVYLPAYPTKVVETAGAGDACTATVLANLLSNTRFKHFDSTRFIPQLTAKELESILIQAQAAASIVCQRYGALCAMPTTQEIAQRAAQF